MARKRKARIFRASDGYDAVELLKFAHDHFHAAEILFRSGHRCLDSAAHLAHVAFELLAKAVLLHQKGAFPGEHSLGRLRLSLKECGIRQPFTRRAQKGFILLSRFEGTRYPAPPASVEIGDEDFPYLVSLWKEMGDQVPPELRSAFAASDPLTKGGRILMVKPKESPLHRAT